ncbi:MAG: aminotransferase class V-fold PLP-dependent enzyme [Anaerofustis stercorihominis]|nr:aminotransferase class V-fold PLP-dependent enzyme [Anaerofustis stercorihominis]
MIRFESDYTEGAHPNIINKLVETNFEQTPGYGVDVYCESARAKIKAACNRPDADVHFLVGGTQANLTVIASILRPYQGVISAFTGHINVHETGSVEATGHKVITTGNDDGKITAQQVADIYEGHWNDGTHEHIVQPGMVYISHPTENGTMYTKDELTALYEVCKKYELPLFIDGARLGYALMSPASDMTLEDVANNCDVFYIGGTKVGALFGEAVVILKDSLKKDFRYNIKQRGAMLAKGRLLGIQFDVLFEDNLYFEISKHAATLAMDIKKAFEEKGIGFRYDSDSNQQFPILTKEQYETLTKKYSVSYGGELPDGKVYVRFCTSWATKAEDVKALIEDIRAL